MAETTARTLNKHIRILPEQWDRIQNAARGTALTPNQLLVELAVEALDQREILGRDAQLAVARASLFAAQAIARDHDCTRP